MIGQPADDLDPHDPLGDVLQDYYTRLERGEKVDRDEFIKSYPEQASVLRDHFDGIDRLEALVKRLPQEVRVPAVRPVRLPCTLAGYELVEEIGRGGMGVVYRAREAITGRELAIKMILTGHLASTDEVERFRGEALAASQLRHPAIVPIFHFGVHEGQHFFTMPLVEGQSLEDRLADGPLPWRDAAELAARVADAIDFAHNHAVVHRDLKPANILLGSDGQPMVSDFGLARRLGEESVRLTTSGGVVGTASYMAPEQARGQLDLVGPATDIYGLGVLLYAMVSGQAPFRSTSLHDTLTEVCERVPDSLRSLSPSVPRDLDTICQKCLEKEPRRRYASAGDVARDLRRLLAGESITARPVRWPERSWRWCRRNRRVALLAGVTLLSMVLGTMAAMYFARRSEQQAHETRVATYAADIHTAHETLVEGASHRTLAVLEKYRSEDSDRDLRGWEWDYLWRQCHAELRRFEGHNGSVNALAASSDGRFLLTGGADKTVRIWQIATGNLLKTLNGHTSSVMVVCVSANGELIASGDSNGNIVIWEGQTGTVLTHFSAHAKPVTGLAFTPDGQTIVSCSEDSWLGAWQVIDGKNIQKILRYPMTSLAMDASGQKLVTCSRGGTVDLWYLSDDRQSPIMSRQPEVLLSHDHCVNSVVFSPDGRGWASCAADRTVRVWTLGDIRNPRMIRRLKDSPNSACFSPDGQFLTIGGREQTVSVWDAQTGELLRTLGVHAANITSTIWLPDGWRIVSASEDGTVRLWASHRDPNRWQPLTNAGTLRDVAFSSDGRWLATSADRGILLWNAYTENVRRAWHGHFGYSVAFSPDNTQLAFVNADGPCYFSEVHVAGETRQIHAPAGHISVVGYRPDGQQLFFGGDGGAIFRCEPKDIFSDNFRSNPYANEITAFAFSNDSQQFVTVGNDLSLTLFDAHTGQQVRAISGHEGPVWDAAFDPTGRLLASASGDRSVRVWNAKTGRQLLRMDGHAGTVWGVTFSPEGRRVISCSVDRTIKVWETTTGAELLSLAGKESWMRSIACSPDGARVAVAGKDGNLYVWDATKPSAEITRHREVGALVAYLAKRFRSRDDVVAAIQADRTISDEVRQTALAEADVYPFYLLFVDAGRQNVERGDFFGAVADFQQVVALAPNHAVHWSWLAMAQFGANQQPEYAETCRTMLARFKDSTVDEDLGHLLTIWAIGQHSQQDLEAMLAMSERAQVRAYVHPVFTSIARAQLYGVNVAVSELAKYSAHTSFLGLHSNAWLAMAYRQLGELSKAELAAQKARLCANDDIVPWDTRARYDLMLRQMEAALVEPLSPDVAAPVAP